MSSTGERIDMTRGMDGSGLAMADMPGMTMPAVHAESSAVPQIARYVRDSGWPELKEALIAGQVKAAMMLAPMAMDLADKGVPVKVVALAPPDMPAALLAHAVDAYATGEPFGAKAEMDGYARVLYMTRDVWPTYICCVLTVRQELIDHDRETVQLLVDHVLAAGKWLETSPEHRTRAAKIASDRSMFNQAFELIKWVMERPSDRVTYGDLRLMRAEFDELMRLSLDAKIIDRPIDYHTYVDESFMKNARPVAIDPPAQ